ncbi:hypothetical protein [Inhella sp.]|uniref:hypothetical protein n=1 Tax=Inhella sp. TaxID=1921806 RepID=UPI0035B02E2A
MADLTNRSRYRVQVRNRDDLTQHFPFNKFEAAKAYVHALRDQGFKPRVEQLDERWLVRIRDKGHKHESAKFASREKAEQFISKTTDERSRGLFVEYTKSLKVSLAQLIVKYLQEESPKHKSHRVTSYCLEGWLEDSGPAGIRLLEQYRDAQRTEGRSARAPKFQMRRSSEELAWIHKPLADITTVDIENYINDRLDVVAPGTVDRDIDRLKAIYAVATTVWEYPLALLAPTEI